MVIAYDPQEAPLKVLTLFVWGFVWWALMGPLSRWAISELLFYIAQERMLLSLIDFIGLVEPSIKKNTHHFRAFYWALFLIFYVARYLIINKAHDPNNYLENRPDLWKKYDYWPPMSPN